MKSREQFEAWYHDEYTGSSEGVAKWKLMSVNHISRSAWQERDRLAKLEREELIMQCAEICREMTLYTGLDCADKILALL
jgi:hypothetical protein